MSKLRHIALAVDNLQETAAFYEQAFGMQRVRESPVAVMLSDGVVSLAIIDLQRNANAGNARPGLHHFGFLVDDLDTASAQVEQAGGQYHGQIQNVGAAQNTERKYRDVNGVVFDIVNREHAERIWRIPA